MSKKTTHTTVQALQEHKHSLWMKHMSAVAKKCAARGFLTNVVGSAEEAKQLVLHELLPACQAQTVSFSGSVSLSETGILQELLSMKDLTVLNTQDYSLPLEQMKELRRMSLLADVYLASPNAVTEDGELVFLDGTGNRCAAVQFGPHKVFLLIGRNKLCPDLASAMDRIKNIAAPANASRLNRKTPCVSTGYCMDCASPDRICSTWTITERSFPEGRIHLIFINEELGY